MIRRLLVVAALALAAVPVWTGSASAGGGCAHTDVTAGEASDDAAVVDIVDFCFTPTLLRVQPGTSVTFVNRDLKSHNVIDTGLRWGAFEDLGRDDDLTVRFDGPGVYPYACYIHPGMVGAVIVGDGSGLGAAATDLGVLRVAPSPATSQPAAPQPATDVASQPSWWTPAGLGVLAGLVIALGARRRGGPRE